jgi:uncharacterized membrane protein
MNAQIYLLMVCAVIFVLCIPLVFKLVPPNRLYGFRTRATLSRPEVWYPANVFSGLSLMIAVLIAAAIILSAPELSAGTIATIFVALVLCATAASFIYLKRIA